MSPHDYPPYLIPDATFVIIDENQLNPLEYIGIWVEPEIELKDDKGRLNGGAVNLHRLPHFSSNKIPHSVPSDLNIKINDNVEHIYLQDWNAGMNGVVPQRNDFDYDNMRTHYFLQISKINGHVDGYEKNDKHLEYQVNLIHKPTVSNYWHFEFTITSEGKEVNYKQRQWINDILGSIRGHIVKKAVFELP